VGKVQSEPLFWDIGYTEEQPSDDEVFHAHLYATLCAAVLLASIAYWFV